MARNKKFSEEALSAPFRVLIQLNLIIFVCVCVCVCLTLKLGRRKAVLARRNQHFLSPARLIVSPGHSDIDES